MVGSPRRSAGAWAAMALLAALAAGLSVQSSGQQAPTAVSPRRQAVHPLDPLTEKEIVETVRILREQKPLPGNPRFPIVALHEPSKESVASFRPGNALRREAFAVVFDARGNRTWEAVVDLAAGRVASWNEIERVQPVVLVEEYEAAAKIVRTDPRWRQAMARRGIDFAEVQLDAWAAGPLRIPGRENARLLRVLSYLRASAVNGYSRPIEGVMAVVDMNAQQLVELVDRGETPVSADARDLFDPATLGPPRPGLRPLSIRQDAGPSFTIDGHEIRWQGWRFRYAFHPRDGLVLYAVGFEDAGRMRSILHRAALSEMLVPYGDADGLWNWRSAFDMGEYGVAQFANSLSAGDDVPENATLLSPLHAGEAGEPVLKENVVAVYEEDAGILWRHTDYETLRTVNRRGRRLVLHTVFTVGNYDYGLKWVFHQDGSLEAQVELTGVLLAKGVDAAECPVCRENPDESGRLSGSGTDRYGPLVAKNLSAPNHQHFFCFRLDFDIDGPRNTVAEIDVLPEAPERNPAGNAFFVQQTRLRTEGDGRRDANATAHRCWKVFNPNERTALGHFPAYRIELDATAAPFARPDSTIRRRGGFLSHALWVTRHRAAETHAAGEYPNQRAEEDGLPRWSGDEPIENEDVVVWPVLGVTHVARPEEWPVMPVARAGIRLLPDGFFTRNPALDVPAVRTGARK